MGITVSVTKNLREIKVGETRVSKSAILTYWEALNFHFHDFLHILKVEIWQSDKVPASKMAKTAVLQLSQLGFT